MHFSDNPVLWVIVSFLAVWRITSIIQRETIASPLRKLIGIVEIGSENEEVDPDFWIYPDNFIGKLFQCFWCGSVWVGLLVTPVTVFFPIALLPFSFSAMAIGFKTWMEKPSIQYNENYYVMEPDSFEEQDHLDDDAAVE